ncbi:aspartate/glutamate racemase family protein [Sneathiella aquimaris]|uniref:aspartate/glutamate racemase family protein n=1 Tax=Sneathiella aquimaris TaxID=2599305 RepID=UPI00146C371F|nr:aspartate/glutamate racemase family protein [Sneathiella aquimaris]
MCPQRNFIVVGGGVGPAAGVAFHQKLIDMLDNRGMGDQGHAPVIHLSMSPYVLDRTAYLLSNQQGINPGTAMGSSVNAACLAFEGVAQKFVVGVPCNTFHSKVVYEAYLEQLESNQICPINMIEETKNYIQQKLPTDKIILLSTSGTRETQVYSSQIPVLETRDVPNPQDKNTKRLSYFLTQEGNPDLRKISVAPQAAVMAAIYDPEIGVKGSEPNFSQAKWVFDVVIDLLKEGHAQRSAKKENYSVIMGCTEIPLAYAYGEGPLILGEFEKYIDPMEILAARLITAAGYPLKRAFAEKYDYMLSSEVLAEPEDSAQIRLHVEDFAENIKIRSKL